MDVVEDVDVKGDRVGDRTRGFASWKFTKLEVHELPLEVHELPVRVHELPVIEACAEKLDKSIHAYHWKFMNFQLCIWKFMNFQIRLLIRLLRGRDFFHHKAKVPLKLGHHKAFVSF